jgi:hypothetical protein
MLSLPQESPLLSLHLPLSSSGSLCTQALWRPCQWIHPTQCLPTNQANGKKKGVHCVRKTKQNQQTKRKKERKRTFFWDIVVHSSVAGEDIVQETSCGLDEQLVRDLASEGTSKQLRMISNPIFQ